MKKQYKKGMSRRAFIKLASGTVAAVSANWFLPRFSWGAADEIRIGFLCELSGGLSTIGVEQRRGAELAAKLINETGGPISSKPGVLGRPVRLLIEDTESKVPTGLAKAQRLVERDQVHILNGVIMSSVSMAVQSYIKTKRIPFVNSGSGNEAIATPPHCGRYFFKGVQGNAQLCRAVEYPAKKYGGRVYFIADDYDWGHNAVKFYKASIERVAKLEVLGEDYPVINEQQYAPYITKIQTAKPDFVACAHSGGGYPRFLKQASQMGLKVPVYENWYARRDIEAAGDAALGMLSGAEFLLENPKIPRVKQIADDFKASTGYWISSNAAHGFNGVEVVCKAIQEAGSTDPEKIVDSLENLVYEGGIITQKYSFRKCDHMPLVQIWCVENVRHPKYVYDAKVLGEIENPHQFMAPCGQTGCEEAMKKT